MPRISQKVLAVLLSLILMVVSLSVFFLSTQRPSPDTVSYLNMGKGLIEGRFSQWYYLESYYPETLRSPGYPLFTAITSRISNSVWSVLIVQYACLLLAYYLCIRIIYKVVDDAGIRGLTTIIFLAMAILSIQLPFYSGQIVPQAVSSFLMVSFFYVYLLHKHTILSGLIQGCILAGIFQLTPSFLLFPLIVFTASIWKREIFRAQIASLIVFIISTLPFGLWNLNNHGVFKITPLEGGAGVAHMSYWQYKLPKNYSESFYWGNNTGDDLIYPFRLSEQEVALNRIRYEYEWEQILTSISHLKTEEDLSWEQIMKDKNPGQFILHNSAYVQAREEQLWNKTIEHMIENPYYYIKTRVYGFFRSYVTGISEQALYNSKNLLQYFNTLYPFFISLILILFGTLFITFRIIINWGKVAFEVKMIFFMVIYFGLIHTPFVTQARYTAPVHILILVLLAIFISPYIKRLISSK